MGRMLSVKEVKDRLGIGINQTYKLVRLASFPAITIGGVIKVDADELEKWIKSNYGKNISLEEI